MTSSVTASPAVIATTMDSPIGELTITSVDGLLTGVHMHEQRHRPSLPPACRRDDSALTHIVAQLNAYFAGDLTDFDLPMAMHGTDFQRRVWAALCEIPYGDTISYGELARLGRQPQSLTRGGPRQRAQPDRDRRSLPSSHRRRRLASPATGEGSTARFGCSSTRLRCGVVKRGSTLGARPEPAVGRSR